MSNLKKKIEDENAENGIWVNHEHDNEEKDQEGPKLIRVELERENGEILYVDGADAEAWDEAVKSQSVFCWVHGHKFPKLNWKKKINTNLKGNAHVDTRENSDEDSSQKSNDYFQRIHVSSESCQMDSRSAVHRPLDLGRSDRSRQVRR